MDYGHYNCRDYYVSPHFSPTTIISERNPLYRHESFEELESRSRSPSSQKPKFPLLRLPHELREQIFTYLLPHTQEFRDSGLLGEHARNFSAVQKRKARGMFIPSGNGSSAAGSGASVNNVVWQRGNIGLLGVCKQLHEECAELMYGRNTFLLFVTFSGTTFRFRWLLPSGLAPSQNKPFLELLPARYLRLIKRVIVHVDHVDSYTGMIKYNVGGKGLTHGLRRQVQRLVNALCASEADTPEDSVHSEHAEDRRLTSVVIRVSNGNAVLDALKSDIVRQREGGIKTSEDLEEMLEPFGTLYGVREVSISGAVTDSFAQSLSEKMRSTERTDRPASSKIDDGPSMPGEGGVQLCVYGNDLP